MDCIGVFFDHKTFGAEQLIVGARQMPFTQLPAMAPLSGRVKKTPPITLCYEAFARPDSTGSSEPAQNCRKADRL
jgi:hypothetical protein